MKLTIKKATIAGACFAVAQMFSTPAYADRGDECAIWLCMPAAFAFPECHDPYLAMLNRVRRLKSPLPGFVGCLESPENNQTNATFEVSEGPRWKDCQEGYNLQFFREDIFEQEFVPFRNGETPDSRTCINYRTGDSYPQIYDRNTHHVRVTIDGVEYDEFSFSID